MGDISTSRVKVLLVGGLGFIGRRFVRKFSEIHQLVIYATHENVLKASKTLDRKKVIIEEGGVEDTRISEIVLKHKPHVIIHLAALTGLKKCHEDPKRAFITNVYGTFNVVNACASVGAKIIFISSREVYGETLYKETIEDSPLLPNNTYGITKMIGEQIVRLAGQKYNLDYTILRLTNVYGPEGDQYGAQVIIKNALMNNRIQILGGGQRLNFVYVDDVVDLINLVTSDNRSSKEIFNVGSKDTLTIEEFACKVIELLGEKIQIDYLPMRETETSNFEPSLKKIEEALGYLPKTSLKDGLQKTIEWYQNTN